MNKVICDECQRGFVITNIKEKKHPKEIIESYFKCPHCHKKYTAYVTDKEARKQQREIKLFHRKIIPRDYSRLSEEEYKAEIDKQQAELTTMKIVLEKRMNELKQQQASK